MQSIRSAAFAAALAALSASAIAQVCRYDLGDTTS